jgi:hypothetical protein
MDAAISLLEKACRPLDRLRLRWLRAVKPVAVPLLRRRDLRVVVFGMSVLVFSLLGTLLAPFWLLALGPILLGTPHLLSDLRYLVFRPGLHRRRGFQIGVGLPVLAAGMNWYPMEFGLLAVAGAAVMARGPAGRKVTVAILLTAAGWAVWRTGAVSQLVFAHLHNFIAVMLWWFWRPGRKAVSAFIPLTFFVLSGLILFGVLTPWSPALSWAPANLAAPDHMAEMAPGMAAEWGLRLVLLFAFAQSVHYGVWLRLIPEDDRPQPAPRTFGASVRALRLDMGSTVLCVTVVLGLVFALWAVLDLTASRSGYLRLALFHGYLELAVAAWFFIERPAARATA